MVTGRATEEFAKNNLLRIVSEVRRPPFFFFSRPFSPRSRPPATGNRRSLLFLGWPTLPAPAAAAVPPASARLVSPPAPPPSVVQCPFVGWFPCLFVLSSAEGCGPAGPRWCGSCRAPPWGTSPALPPRPSVAWARSVVVPGPCGLRASTAPAGGARLPPQMSGPFLGGAALSFCPARILGAFFCPVWILFAFFWPCWALCCVLRPPCTLPLPSSLPPLLGAPWLLLGPVWWRLPG